MNNKLVGAVIVALFTGLFANPSAQAQTIPIAITVEVLKAAKDIHPAPATKVGSEDRALEITLKNPSSQALSNLNVKCWLLVRDVRNRDITVGDADSNTLNIPPRSQVVMTSSVTKCDFTPRTAAGAKSAPAKGSKFYGYGVQVLQRGKVALQTYDPPDVKTEIDAALKKDK